MDFSIVDIWINLKKEKLINGIPMGMFLRFKRPANHRGAKKGNNEIKKLKKKPPKIQYMYVYSYCQWEQNQKEKQN